MVAELQGIDFRRGTLALLLPAVLVALLLMEIPPQMFSFKATRRRAPAAWAVFARPDAAAYERLSANIRTSWQLSARARVSGSTDPAAGLYVLEESYPPPAFMDLPAEFVSRDVQMPARIPQTPLFPPSEAADALSQQAALAPAGTADPDRERLRRELLDIDLVLKSSK